MDEEERAQLVRDCLYKIADALKGRPFRDFFKSKDDRLWPNDLIKGLRSLGLEDFEKNVFVVFMESLQHEEEEEELCVDLPYLESLLDHYSSEVAESGSQPEIPFTDSTDRKPTVERHISVLDTPGADDKSRGKSPAEQKKIAKTADDKPDLVKESLKKEDNESILSSSSDSDEAHQVQASFPKPVA